jgi:hypothetical protein
MQVELYIYLPNNFEVTADLTSITADSDIITADVTMLEDLYTAEKLDLFQDEKISVTQNLINYQDISKLFADYSQSFTIPASTRNNKILKYWYDNALVDGFDARYRYDGFIEVDKVRFKIGTFQLDSVTIKERKPENYKVTFFGKVKQIKDLFGDAKLSTLDYSSLNHPYTATDVYNRIIGTTSYDVRYPLLAHDRLYDFGGGGPNDVTTNAGAIQWTSLFPTIKVSKIFDLIQSQYGITFNSIFFGSYNQYKRLWLLLKNAESMTAQATPTKINFTSKNTGFNAMDLTADDCNFNGLAVPFTLPSGIQTAYATPTQPSLKITTSSTVNYRVNYYRNGNLIGASNVYSGTNTISLLGLANQSNPNRISFELVSDAPMTFTSEINLVYSAWFGFVLYTFVGTATGASQTTVSDLNIANYVPDIKLYDFFMGIVKMFNLIIVPTSETEFTIEPMELWYSIGKINDITKNVIEESIDLTPPKIFKELSFNYEKSENILNNAFRELFTNIRGFDYGDLRFISDTTVTDSKYETKLPFENVMFERDNGSTFQTTTFKDKNLNNYLPKPVLMYDNGSIYTENSSGTSIPIKFYNGSTYQNINIYRRFSNGLSTTELFTSPGLVPTAPGMLLSTNWNNEQSSWFVNSVMDGLYQNHYSQWVSSLYDVNARVLTCKAYFNPFELSNIAMNDRIVIKDARYVINNITTDITTGESNLELLTDFRPTVDTFIGSNIGFRMANIDSMVIPKDAFALNIVAFLDQFEQFDYLASPNGLLSYTLKTGVTDNDDFNVTMPANATGVQRTDAVALKYYLDGELYYYFINITQEG